MFIRLLSKILKNIQNKLSETDYRINKVVQSNQRNTKRLLRHRARLEELKKCKQSPELLLALSGVMNEYVQAFMISHNFQMNVDVTSMNPDNMTYEQLLELGQKIGKVSKGLSKQEIETLEHINMKKTQQNCSICCFQFKINQIGIKLRCNHVYHEECILEWLKDQNVCPMCKQHVLKQETKQQS